MQLWQSWIPTLGTNDKFTYDPALILISGNDLPKPILYAATVGIDDTFLMVGGQGEKEVYDSIYKYDNGDWLEMPQKLSVARFYSTALMVPKDSYPICPNWIPCTMQRVSIRPKRWGKKSDRNWAESLLFGGLWREIWNRTWQIWISAKTPPIVVIQPPKKPK